TVDFLVRSHGRTVLDVTLPPVPAAGRPVRAVFIEAPVLRRLADLPPFAGLAGRITVLLEQSGNGILVLGLGAGATLPPRHVGETAGAEGVTARHEQTARRAAQRRGIAGLEAHARLGERVDVGRPRLVLVGTATANAVQTEIVGQDEDDVGLVDCG